MTMRAKCPGDDCPSKEGCFRYRAEDGWRQTRVNFNAERDSNKDKCDDFLQLYPETRKRLEERKK